jgi:hypothetical protein
MRNNNPKPTVDLGYPTQPHGRIPTFNSIEEEAESWDTHDFTDFSNLTEPFELTVGPGSRRSKSKEADAGQEDV